MTTAFGTPDLSPAPRRARRARRPHRVIAERAGVEALYHGGYALAAHHFGLPDVGLVGRAEVVESVRRMRGGDRPPDHRRRRHRLRVGGGRVADGARARGAPAPIAVQIEDQVSPKRCGHMEGKEVIPTDEMAIKVRAAVAARRVRRDADHRALGRAAGDRAR